MYRAALDGDPVAVKVVDNASTLRKIGVQIVQIHRTLCSHVPFLCGIAIGRNGV